MSLNGTINGFVGKAKIPTNVAVYGAVIAVVAAIGWYQLYAALDATWLQTRITRCEVAEIRQHLIDKKPFRNDCFRIIEAWAGGKVSDLNPGE